MIVPRQYALALVVPGPGGDRVLGYVAPPQLVVACVALRPSHAAKWGSLGELGAWFAAHGAWVLDRLDPPEGCRCEPVGLVAGGGGAP